MKHYTVKINIINLIITQSAGVIEYNDWIPAKE